MRSGAGATPAEVRPQCSTAASAPPESRLRRRERVCARHVKPYPRPNPNPKPSSNPKPNPKPNPNPNQVRVHHPGPLRAYLPRQVPARARPLPDDRLVRQQGQAVVDARPLAHQDHGGARGARHVRRRLRRRQVLCHLRDGPHLEAVGPLTDGADGARRRALSFILRVYSVLRALPDPPAARCGRQGVRGMGHAYIVRGSRSGVSRACVLGGRGSVCLSVCLSDLTSVHPAHGVYAGAEILPHRSLQLLHCNL